MLAGHIFCTPRGCQNPRLFTYISLHVICFDSLSLIPSQPPIFGGWYQLHTSYIPHNRELGPYITGQPLTTWPHHPNWVEESTTRNTPWPSFGHERFDLKIGPSDLWCAASGAGAGAGTSGTVVAKPIRRSAGGVMFFFPIGLVVGMGAWRCDVVVLYRVGLGWRSFENNLLGWRCVTLIVEKVLQVLSIMATVFSIL